MGLGDLFKRFSKGASEDEKKAAAAAKTKGGKKMPPLPNFLKKDRFVREAPPEAQGPGPSADLDMADAGSFKRPGKWLKERLGGSTDSQAMNNIEKTKTALKKGGGLNDQEIQNFLDGFLDEGEAPASTAASPPLTKGP